MFKLIAWMFRCRHRHTSWPQGKASWRNGQMPPHVVCLDCGKEFPYTNRAVLYGSTEVF